ncbi:Phosphoadenosine phosphosulfate reductase [termite gut metagenome]|uniref:Phosphoadenosine phosphosulfate reductase n=1 Tax=termite gut metagenome TaxID=433724 RepID=A0A5J4R864_9ZZZZ
MIQTNMNLEEKIGYSIRLIQKAEKLALQYSPDGFHLAFSGGKDSQTLHELTCMAGVKFHAEMSVTTVDPPELMKFVRRYYPQVKLNRPKINMFHLIEKKKGLPRMNIRYCCQILKEQAGAGTVTLLGIRAAESVKRAKRNEVEISGHKFSGSLDQFNIFRETQTACIKGKDKIMVSPIFHWTDEDVWHFIRSRNMPYCKLYDMGFTRIGCMFCPMSRPKTKAIERQMYPRMETAYKKAIQFCIDHNGYGNTHQMNADEIFDCWVNNQSFSAVLEKRKQLNIEFANAQKIASGR